MGAGTVSIKPIKVKDVQFFNKSVLRFFYQHTQPGISESIC